MVDIAKPKFSDWKSEAIRKQVELNNETAAPQTDSQSSNPSTTNSATRFTRCLLDFSFRRDEKRSRRSGACDGKSVNNAPLEDRELLNVPTSQLEKCLEPILVQLQELDAESLLSLTRVESGGAILCEGCVYFFVLVFVPMYCGYTNTILIHLHVVFISFVVYIYTKLP